jgi:acyl-CoA synthetase (NDP forming)
VVLTFHLCNETGELPVTQWEHRQPFVEEPQKARKALSNAERQRRFRQRHRNDNRNDEYGCRDTEVRQQGHKLLSSPTTRTEALQKPQNRIDSSPAAGTHVHIYQGEVKPAETPAMDDYPELPEFLRRKSQQTIETY